MSTQPATVPQSLLPRGFAAMNPERQRQIASLGGLTAQALGRAHRYTSEEARIAGQRGGAAISQDREHMAAIGRLGGRQRARSAQP